MASMKELAALQAKRARVMKEFKEGPASKSPTQGALDKMSFGKAFNEKRVNQKAKTFTWRGKKYTTKLATATPTTTTKTSTIAERRAAKNAAFNKKIVAARKKREAEKMAKVKAGRAQLPKAKPKAKPTTSTLADRRAAKSAAFNKKIIAARKKRAAEKMAKAKARREK